MQTVLEQILFLTQGYYKWVVQRIFYIIVWVSSKTILIYVRGSFWSAIKYPTIPNSVGCGVVGWLWKAYVTFKILSSKMVVVLSSFLMQKSPCIFCRQYPRFIVIWWIKIDIYVCYKLPFVSTLFTPLNVTLLCILEPLITGFGFSGPRFIQLMDGINIFLFVSVNSKKVDGSTVHNAKSVKSALNCNWQI